MARFTHEKIVMALLGRHVTVIHVSTDFSHFSCLGCILRYTRGYCIIYYGQAFVSFGVFCSRNSSLVIPGDPCPFKRLLGHELQWPFVFIQRRCIWSIVYHITRLIVYSGDFLYQSPFCLAAMIQFLSFRDTVGDSGFHLRFGTWHSFLAGGIFELVFDLFASLRMCLTCHSGLVLITLWRIGGDFYRRGFSPSPWCRKCFGGTFLRDVPVTFRDNLGLVGIPAYCTFHI